MRKLKFSLVLSLVLVFGVVLSFWAPKFPAHTQLLSDYPHWESFLHLLIAGLVPRVGEAMIISVCLAIAVDRAAKERLLAEFAEDVSSHIIGRFLPNALREHIHSYLSVDVVRSNLEIIFILTEISESDMVEVHTTMTSDLLNYSFKEVDEPILVSVDADFNSSAGESKITEIRVGDFTYMDGDVSQELKRSKASVSYSQTPSGMARRAAARETLCCQSRTALRTYG